VKISYPILLYSHAKKANPVKSWLFLVLKFYFSKDFFIIPV